MQTNIAFLNQFRVALVVVIYWFLIVSKFKCYDFVIGF